MIELFSGLSARQFAKLVRQLRSEGAEPALKGRPWGLAFEDRVLLVAAYWRTNLTMRQIAALFGTSKSAADRIIDDLAPRLPLRPRQRFAPETVLIVDGTLVPTRDHTVAAKSKNYRYSTNHQVVIHADTQLVVAVGVPLPGNRNDSKAFGESGVDESTRTATVIADGGYPGTRAVIPHRRKSKDKPLVGEARVPQPPILPFDAVTSTPSVGRTHRTPRLGLRRPPAPPLLRSAPGASMTSTGNE